MLTEGHGTGHAVAPMMSLVCTVQLEATERHHFGIVHGILCFEFLVGGWAYLYMSHTAGCMVTCCPFLAHCWYVGVFTISMPKPYVELRTSGGRGGWRFWYVPGRFLDTTVHNVVDVGTLTVGEGTRGGRVGEE